MFKKGITQRWIVNCLGITFIILIVFEISAIFTIRNFYYSSAEQFMLSKLSIMSELIVSYSDDSTKNLSVEIRNIIETFNDKDKMELMGINHKGQVSVTSSGFYYFDFEGLNDYDIALNTPNGISSTVGRLANGEYVMSICMIIPVINSEFAAIRFIASLEQINGQILNDILFVTCFCIAVFLFVIVSGLYFIKSIVSPVRDISAAAKKIASGDFNTRIQKVSNDELGDLCEIINYMAIQISDSDKVKNDFISSVSHELRTPLTAIKGWGETIMDTKMNDIETIRKGMKVIISESERLSYMVEELLDFSRIQSGRFNLVKTKIDVLAELEEALIIYIERGKRDNIEIKYNSPSMLPFIYGDKNRLRQVFLNIIDNALKYSESGGIINIAAHEQEDFIVIKVEDNGCGINEQDLPFVTQKFYKANLTKRGSGIGLAVANEIVNLHNGSLCIESKEGVGTVVSIKLPLDYQNDEIIEVVNKMEQSGLKGELFDGTKKST